VKVSKWSTLLLLLLLGVTAGWALLQALRSNNAMQPEVSWLSAPFILFFALLILVIKRRVKILPTTFVGRLSVLAKTSSHGGALIAGLYFGFAIFQIPNLSSGFGRHQLWNSLIDSTSASSLVFVGIILEKALKNQNL